MNKASDLNQLNEEQLRALAAQLQDRIQTISLENDKLKHEMAVLKRHKYARTSEALNQQQRTPSSLPDAPSSAGKRSTTQSIKSATSLRRV